MSDGFEWLDWLEPSGPFVAAPVLKKAFPQGLDTLDPKKRRELRQAYDEYRQALDDEDPEAGKFQAAWIDLVLRKGLEYDEDESGDNLKSAADLPDSLVSQAAEHGVTLKPDYAVVNDQNTDKSMMLIQVYDRDVNLIDAIRGDGWASSPRERMVRLCRDTGIRLGLVTNGEHWLFVDAPIVAVSSFASWYARLWGPEPVLLQALVALLGIRRLFVAEDEQLPALIDKSVEYQDEVTEALGEQVRRAVEVLIQALDKADLDRNRDLLKDVKPRELYEAGLTVMMRLVFLLSAEERELLLLGDERYEANYAVSTLRMQLRGEDDAILQRRWDAWSRLLAIFRAIFGGIEHETLRMPALGGSLFDPDRFPFLEGRDKDSNWRTDPAKPLPIDNQTVLLLLDAIQLFEGRTLSYRGLDVEQLGYVYEGLLDHTVKRAKEVTLELDATKNAKQPWVTIGELESSWLDGEEALVRLLKKRTGSSISRVRNDLGKETKPQQLIGLLTACHNDQALHEQLKKYIHLIRTDSWGRPMVYPQGSFMVTTGDDRRQTGSHYTPSSLTEAIVRKTLEPVVYIGPAEGKPRKEWQLKTPEELLDLKICDPAMGSGAFLVQVCRWLGERVVESWAQVEEAGKQVDINGSVIKHENDLELMPRDSEERSVSARRLIAERCIYGVDLNPLAVELAKLSIWLVTLSEGRPLGFLDHNLKSGDSLLGIRQLSELTQLSLSPDDAKQKGLFGQEIFGAVDKAVNVRLELRNTCIRDIHDVERMTRLDRESRETIGLAVSLADGLIAAVLSAKSDRDLQARTSHLAVVADQASQADPRALEELNRSCVEGLSEDSEDRVLRKPFHWPLEFPEVFGCAGAGFNAVIGNPPFMGGRMIANALGKSYYSYLCLIRNQVKGSPDLCVFFFLRAFTLLCENGYLGLIGTQAIRHAGNREVGLDQVIGMGGLIYSAISLMEWPGSANVHVSIVHIAKGDWAGTKDLDDAGVDFISGGLDRIPDVTIHPLPEMKSIGSQGFTLSGSGFILNASELEDAKTNEPNWSEVVFPFFNGGDLVSKPVMDPHRWVIDFGDRDEDEARYWPYLFERLEKLVKPHRINQTGQIHQDCFWKFWDMRPALRIELRDRTEVLAIPRDAKYVVFRFVNTNQRFNDAVKLLFIDRRDIWKFGALQSTIHSVWARWRSSNKGASGKKYSTSKALDTFPWPRIGLEQLDSASIAYDSCRDSIMSDRSVGLTDVYNLVNSLSESSRDIENFRDAVRELDKAVVASYGWEDLGLNHDFHRVADLPENDQMRFTISEDARALVIAQLAQLNNERSKGD